MPLVVKFASALMLALVLFPQYALAQVQCYGIVQAVATDAAGNISVGILPTPPSTTQPCPAPCNPDPVTHWTYLALPSGSAARDLVYSGALAGVFSGKQVYISALPPASGSSNCQINVFQLHEKYQ
jgi:hypothetical protein